MQFTRAIGYSLYPEAEDFFYSDPPLEPPTDPLRQEKKLLKAILVRAILDATGNTYLGAEGSRPAKKNAIEWIFDPLDTETPFTYGYICFALDIDPEVIRTYLNNSEYPIYKNRWDEGRIKTKSNSYNG